MKIRSEKHRRFVASHPCCVCGAAAPGETKSQAAHVRFGHAGGLGLKPCDSRTVPLCDRCHRLQHESGERRWWKERGIDPIWLAQFYARNSPDPKVRTT